ncbi:WhiB family transcriptional regulator [Streptomyces sp. NPDC001914]|uniref:WhiB family transcriptional regulator n=1 Tax=Streptomyces sp. NPDC001914 TaxID=3364623 RepID=UPI0036C21ACA
MDSTNGQVPGTRTSPRDWRSRAQCLKDPDLFFARETQVVARKVCIGCPVRVECLDDILATERGEPDNRRHGVVAGLTGRERWRLDPTAPGHGDDGASLLDLDTPDPKCGSHDAMIRHLSRGAQVDAECWTGLQHRERQNQFKRGQPEPALAAVPEPKRRRKAEPKPKPEPAPQPRPEPVARIGLPLGATTKERHVYRLWSEGLPDLHIARRADISTQAVRRVRDTYGLIANPPTAKAS